eukprot:102137-Amorphochlora_amoeboformis.AAC.1
MSLELAVSAIRAAHICNRPIRAMGFPDSFGDSRGSPGIPVETGFFAIQARATLKWRARLQQAKFLALIWSRVNIYIGFRKSLKDG